MSKYEEIVAKLKSGAKLTYSEIQYMVYDGNVVEEIEGHHHRWTRDMQTILNIDDELWAINWECGLTENQEDEFYNQPYRVEMREKQVVVREYVRIG